MYPHVLIDCLSVSQMYEEAESILSLSPQKAPSPRPDIWFTALCACWSLSQPELNFVKSLSINYQLSTILE